jgi:hypothetical protein
MASNTGELVPTSDTTESRKRVKREDLMLETPEVCTACRKYKVLNKKYL